MIDLKSLSKKFYLEDFLALAILIFYLICRSAVRHFFTIENGYNSLDRDSILNIPRTLCFIATIFVYKKSEKFTFKVVNDNLFLTAIVFAVLSALVYLQSKFVELYQLNSTQLLLFTVGSFIVGFFEETLFRGLLLAKLQKTLSRLQSLIIMSAVFAFYHYGMQPLSAFPFLFMFGILTGQLANLRVSLFWLGIFHGIYDTMWGIWYPATSIPYAFKIVEFITVCILNVAVFYYSKSIYVRKTQINTNATY